MENPYKILLETFGEDMQFLLAIEEMSELTKAICKYQRKNKTCTENERQKLIDDILEEVADVQVNIDQLSYMFGEEKVKEIKDYKIKRALQRAEKKNNEVKK